MSDRLRFTPEPLAQGIVGAETGEPFWKAAVRVDRWDEFFAKRFFAMPNDGGELRQLAQTKCLEERFDFPLVVVGAFSG